MLPEPLPDRSMPHATLIPKEQWLQRHPWHLTTEGVSKGAGCSEDWLPEFHLANSSSGPFHGALPSPSEGPICLTNLPYKRQATALALPDMSAGQPLTIPGRPPKALQMNPTIHAACSAMGGLMFASRSADLRPCWMCVACPKGLKFERFKKTRPTRETKSSKGRLLGK